jgi:hypothetical protein
MTDVTASRRTFLRGAAGLGSATLIPRIGWADAGAPHYLNAAGLPDGSYWLLGLTEDGAETFRLPLPDRGHAAAAHPERPEAVAFARRPGTFAVVIDCAEGREIVELHAPEDRHFYGHGAFTRDGTLLFTTENAISAGAGRLGVWDASDGYKRIGEVSTGGAGPHEVRLMPDGRRLAVANGGIETDPTSGRAELNIATMVSSLAYVDVETGEVIDVLGLAPEHRLLSIRHLAAGRDGTLAAALQWQGSELEAPPLLAVHRPGAGALELHAAAPGIQRRTRNYAGSVAITDDSRRAAYTAPRGNMMLIFDLAGDTPPQVVEATDICGLAAAGTGFACSTGEGLFLKRGGTTAPDLRFERVAFDNHLVRIAAVAAA